MSAIISAVYGTNMSANRSTIRSAVYATIESAVYGTNRSTIRSPIR